MTRQRAWILAALITLSVVALIIGIGATFGQFGFRGGREAANAVSATQGAPAQSGFFLSTDDQDFPWEDDEHEERYEGDDHRGEWEREGRDDREEHDDDHEEHEEGHEEHEDD